MKITKQTNTTISLSPGEYNVKETKHVDDLVLGKLTSAKRIKHSIMNPADKRKFSAEETIKRIIKLTEGLANFWKSSKAWAPIEASELLTKSRLDWQASLARQLELFLDKTNTESGLLILAWTTLGSLTEGALKLFLSVYYKVYQTQNLAKEFKPVKDKKGNHISPDGLMLEKLRLFYADRVFPRDAKEQWKKQGEIDWLEWVLKIQQRRNAIHAFKNKEIGNIEEFHSELQNYLIFLRKVNNALPYPDEMYMPVEDISDSSAQEIGLQVDGVWIKGLIKKGKLHVASKKDGDFLKEHLEKFLKENIHDIEDIEIVDKLFLSD